MSQLLIQSYLNRLADLRKVSGTQRESVVREAFKDLLKGWARAPMTYRLRNGTQFVVIAAGGHGKLGTRLGDSLVAYALP